MCIDSVIYNSRQLVLQEKIGFYACASFIVRIAMCIDSVIYNSHQLVLQDKMGFLRMRKFYSSKVVRYYNNAKKNKEEIAQFKSGRHSAYVQEEKYPTKEHEWNTAICT